MITPNKTANGGDQTSFPCTDYSDFFAGYKNKAAVALGRLSHSRQSEAQAQASRQNGKLGGRPRKICVHDTAQSVIQVNRAIRHLGIEVIRGKGYFYFWSIDPAAAQVGDSVMVPYLNCMSLHRWIRAAEAAVEEHNDAKQ